MSNTITVYKRDKVEIPVTVTDNDGLAFDLTGYEMFMTVKKNKIDTVALINRAEADISTPASGIGTFTLSTDDTNFASGRYFYDIEISNSVTGDVKTVVLDEFVLEQDLTLPV